MKWNQIWRRSRYSSF